ncbi:hypothetical protein CKO28_23015 [Rhodovibrio sodomensis]|uniref:Uncharacterized protein n=1 Tax=Rhodovibrio sodomensis TaxID=1088 RepID=A0ABS1DK59_9PROT|nr:hypothetical protein [Rhodovibrio sodomensis]
MMRVTSGRSRVRESRPPGSVRAKPNGLATRPRALTISEARMVSASPCGGACNTDFSLSRTGRSVSTR